MSRTVRRLNPVRVNRSGRTQVVYARSGRTMDTYSTGRVTAVVVSSLHYYRVDRTTNSQECVSLYMYIHIYMYMRVCIYVYVYTYITCFFGASTCRLAHAPLRSDSLITLELTHLPITVVAFHSYNLLHFLLIPPFYFTSRYPDQRDPFASFLTLARFECWTLDPRILESSIGDPVNAAIIDGLLVERSMAGQ